MEAYDKAVTMATQKLMAASPLKAIPWEIIITAILGILQGCVNPTPADARKQLASAGPFLKLRLLRKLMQSGLSAKEASAAVQAAIKAANDSSDEEAKQFLEMASAIDA